MPGNLVVDIAQSTTLNGQQLALWTANGGLNQMFEIKRQADGFYSVRAMCSGKAVDASGDGLLAMTPVIQWENHGGDNQRWALVRNADGTITFVAKSSGLVLDVNGARAVNSALLLLYYPHGGANQKFNLAPVPTDPLQTGSLYNIAPFTNTSQRLDIKGSSRDAGAQVLAWVSNGGLNQKFQAVRVNEATYTFSSLNSGLLLTASASGVTQQAAASGNDGLPLATQQWVASYIYGGVRLVNVATNKALALASGTITLAAPSSASSQAFLFTVTPPLGNGTYRIETATGQRVLDVNGGSLTAGTAVQLWDRTDSAAQSWYITRNANGSYTLRCCASGMALDVNGASVEPGARVQQWDTHGGTAQQWEIAPTGDGWFTLTSPMGTRLAVTKAGDFNGCLLTTALAVDPTLATSEAIAQRFRFTVVSAKVSYPYIQKQLSSASTARELTSFGGYTPSASVRSALKQATDSGYGNRGYQVGFIMVDLYSGEGIAYNPGSRFYSASTIKGPYVASLVSTNPASYQRFSSTMASTINVSSNEGYSQLYRAYGAAPIRSWCNDAGVNPGVMNTQYVRYTPSELGQLWLRNYQFFTSDQPYASNVRSWYTAPLNSMIYRELGGSYTTWSKPGWHWISGAESTNDAGVVLAGDRPYLVVILSNAPARFDDMRPLIRAIENAHQEMVR